MPRVNCPFTQNPAHPLQVLTARALIRVFKKKNVDKPSDADKYEYFHDFKLG